MFEFAFCSSKLLKSYWKVLKVIPDQVDLVLVQIILIQLGVIVQLVQQVWKFAIKKLIPASHHHGHLKFIESAGMHCTSNAYFSIAYSLIKKLSIWKSWYLDHTLEQGDILFKSVGIEQQLAVDELPINFKIENFDYDLQ